MKTDPHALLSVVTPTLGGCRIIKHHPQAVSPLAKSQGYIVAEVTYRMVDGHPDEETLRYAHEFAASPQLLSVLERVWAHWAGGDVPEDLARDIPRVLKLARGEK